MRKPLNGTLNGLQRKIVFSRLRAMVGLRWELPWLLDEVEIPTGSLCLEIGTGIGWGTLGLVQHNHSIRAIATDYDGTILPVAQAYLNQHEPASHVTFCQADAKHLPFPDDTFDLVLGLYVLHHVLSYRQALNEIGRVTKTGGQFLFIDIVRIPLMPGLRNRFPPEGLPSRRGLTTLLAETGFRVVRWWGLLIWVLVTSHKEI